MTCVLVVVVRNARSSCAGAAAGAIVQYARNTPRRARARTKQRGAPLPRTQEHAAAARAHQEEEDDHCEHGEERDDGARQRRLRQVAARVGSGVAAGGKKRGARGGCVVRCVRARAWWRTRAPLNARTAALCGTSPGCAAGWSCLTAPWRRRARSRRAWRRPRAVVCDARRVHARRAASSGARCVRARAAGGRPAGAPREQPPGRRGAARAGDDGR
jgi:hypothetical protein